MTSAPDQIETHRHREYTWNDPMITAMGGRDLDGMSALKAIVDGTLPAPPIAIALGFDLETADPGHAVFAFTPAEYHYNPIGSVHGGVFATLLDSAAGCAVHSMLPAGVRYTTLDLNVKYLRPITTQTGRVRAIGTVTHLGTRTALAEAKLQDEGGRLLATATSSCLIIRPT
ncbi:PaaI family thioesterase [Sphaerisporangium sp. B11E5]|uniref:PaaI family thioesterase n=1 Tax=Sphaerisporangium sp. B11E5 TaxID=3153563 RepID=UPI00325C4606